MTWQQIARLFEEMELLSLIHIYADKHEDNPEDCDSKLSVLKNRLTGRITQMCIRDSA